ncbi:MAG: phage capsid protein [Pseudomonadales bacterium]|nr:phage capsid protein [Pseudomonadales bacterium]
MSDNITEARIRQYSSTIEHLAQQMHTRFRDKVRVDSAIKGKMSLYNQIGTVELQDKISRHQKTPSMDVPHLRRALFCRKRHAGVLVDEEDLTDIMNDPTSDYGAALSKGSGRKQDSVIVEAMFGDAKTGEEGDTTVPLPAGQKIVHGGTGIEQVKILTAKKTLDANEVDELIPRYAALSSEQFEELFNDSEITSSDFNTVHALVKGELNTWVGFEWCRSERLPTLSTGQRQCPFWAKDGVLLGIKGDTRVRVGERPDLSYDGQVYVDINIGATRLQETMVVEVQCTE